MKKLNEVLKKRQNKKKENIPEIEVDDKKVESIVNDYAECSLKKKEIESTLRVVKDDLLEYMNQKHDEECFKKFTKSIKLKSNNSNLVCSWKDQFSIDENNYQEVYDLINKMGGDGDSLLKKVSEISIKSSKNVEDLNSKQKEKLFKAISLIEEVFEEEIGFNTYYTTTSDFDREMYSLSRNQNDLQKLRDLINQYSPAIKVVKND